MEYLQGPIEFRERLCEALEGAEDRVWMSIAFYNERCKLMGDSGVLETLQRVAERGVEVRVLAWDCPFEGLGSSDPGNFCMTEAHVADAERLAPDVGLVFDPSPSPFHCHHTKDWIVDNTSFIGGINLKSGQHWADPDTGAPLFHDNYACVGADVAPQAVHDHQVFFAARWNALADRDDIAVRTLNVPYAHLVPRPIPQHQDPEGGEEEERPLVEFRSNVMEGLYGSSSLLGPGSESIAEFFVERIEKARSSVVIESTHIGHVPVLEALVAAADRGVDVVYVHGVWPTIPESKEARKFRSGVESRYTRVFELTVELSQHPNVTYVTVLAPLDAVQLIEILPSRANNVSGRVPKHLHSKLALFDQCHWITGSANQIDLSLSSDPKAGHTETALSVTHDPASTSAVWNRVLHEYGLPEGTSPRGVAETARSNQRAWIEGRELVGNVVALDLAWVFGEMDLEVGHDLPRMDLKLFSTWRAGAEATGGVSTSSNL